MLNTWSKNRTVLFYGIIRLLYYFFFFRRQVVNVWENIYTFNQFLSVPPTAGGGWATDSLPHPLLIRRSYQQSGHRCKPVVVESVVQYSYCVRVRRTVFVRRIFGVVGRRQTVSVRPEHPHAHSTCVLSRHQTTAKR